MKYRALPFQLMILFYTLYHQNYSISSTYVIIQKQEQIRKSAITTAFAISINTRDKQIIINSKAPLN